MRKLFFMVVAILLATNSLLAQTKAGKVDTTTHTTLYSCPKHPGVTGHDPGKCSKCGMELSLSGKEQMKTAQRKNYSCPLHADVTTHNPGKCPKCGKELNLSPKEQMKYDVANKYTCPMHPEVAHDKEGKCPKCGRALVEKKRRN